MISLPSVTFDGIELLKQIMSCHPTVKQYKITDTDHPARDGDDDDDDDMKLALAMSRSMAALEKEMHASCTSDEPHFW